MATPVFRFGAFRLDATARELLEHGRRIDLPLSTVDFLIHLIRHRDRPVGRDELAAAVWGRVDVSEVSLSHAVMRLRRVLGDDGNTQRVIRTVPRFGYRWVAAVDADTDIDADSDADASARAPAPPPAAPRGHARAAAPWRRLGHGAAVLAVILAIALAGSAARRMPVRAAADSAFVLPAAIEAGADAAWLRLGLMDLLATRLHRGGLAATPNETVLALLSARGDDVAGERPARWRVRPRARFAHGEWTVSIAADGDGRVLEVETRADDAFGAARAAADELLIKLGHAPPPERSDDAALAAATLRARIDAALLSGRTEIARRIVGAAPPALRLNPEIAFAEGRIALFSGDYEACREQLDTLLARLPDAAPKELRARVLNALGAVAHRQGRYDAAAAAYAAAVRLLQDAGEPDVLAASYIGSGAIAAERSDLDRAAADYGRARTLYEASGDRFGVATVDLDLGINAMQRGRPAEALPLLESVRERLRRFAAADALTATEIVLVEAKLQTLDVAGALADSAHFVSAGSDAGDPRRRWQLTFARAAALHGAGRLAEADALLARLRDASDPSADALARALGDALAARIALERGDPDAAAELAGAAMTPTLERRNRDQYLRAWTTRVRARQQRGDLAGAAAEIARLRAWAAAEDDAAALPIALADAQQAAAEGDAALALARYAEAMARAARQAVPDDVVEAGLPYVEALLAARRFDEAISVNGRIAPWADRDVRAARAAAKVYRALGRDAAADTAADAARRLAGERRFADDGALAAAAGG
ncbi:MAG TPA: winged helix-turn-helix domain-containing protein [Dokdonella sp.]